MFKKWIYENRNWVFQNFPFLENDFDALTDYELFSKMVEYAKSLAITNEKFVNDLKADLEEMYNEGKFDSFIEEIINLQTTFTFDCVADLKLATNLINGCFARTSGFYAYNDGGGAFYKIRTITVDDTVNEMNIIGLYDENLIAELVVDNVCNVKQYGALGNDEHDDTLNIQACFNDNDVIYLPKGIYKITNSLNINKSNFTLYGDNKTLTFIKKYGNDTLNTQVSYDSNLFDYSDYPSIINLVFETDTNLSNVYIHDISLYDAITNVNNGIIAPHISYCNFERIRITNCSKGIKYGGWINKILNSEFLNIPDVSLEGIDTIYTIINGIHGNKIAVSNAKGLYILNSAFDNGYPCFEIINSTSVNIYNCSTETNRMVLRNTNSLVIINGGDLEGHSNVDLTLFKGFFVNQSNGETYIKNANIHFDDYLSAGNPDDKNLISNTGGIIKLNDNKITLPYTYTVYNTGTYTTQIDDVVYSSIGNTTKKTGRFSVTDNTSVEVLRLPFAYGKNYMLNIKSWASFTYHMAINIETQMVACANGTDTGISDDVDYIVAKPPESTFNSYLHLEKEDDELVLYYKSTNAYGNDIYFEIEYTNN